MMEKDFSEHFISLKLDIDIDNIWTGGGKQAATHDIRPSAIHTQE